MSQEPESTIYDETGISAKVQTAAEVEARAAAELAEPFEEPNGLANKLVGSVLSWIAVCLFYLTCMFLPLVGPAGNITPHAGKNSTTFLIVIILALVVSVAAFVSRMQRRRVADGAGREIGGGFPWIQAAFVAVNLAILVLLFTGRLAI